MNNKLIILILALTSINYAFSQTYVQVNQQNNLIYNTEISPLAMSYVAGSIDRWRNSWENNKRIERNRADFQNQLNNTRTRYLDQKEYPETIADGWHLVMATDNMNYCSEAKVLVENNRITKFYIDNYLSIPIKDVGKSEILKGRVSINIVHSKSTDDTVEVYFIYDLDQPFIVDKPLEPGYICIYSDLKSGKHVQIKINDVFYGRLGGRHEEQPNYADFNTLSLKLKPGVYNIKAAGRGTISWNFDVYIKEDQCLFLNLNKENKY